MIYYAMQSGLKHKFSKDENFFWKKTKFFNKNVNPFFSKQITHQVNIQLDQGSILVTC